MRHWNIRQHCLPSWSIIRAAASEALWLAHPRLHHVLRRGYDCFSLHIQFSPAHSSTRGREKLKITITKGENIKITTEDRRTIFKTDSNITYCSNFTHITALMLLLDVVNWVWKFFYFSIRMFITFLITIMFWSVLKVVPRTGRWVMAGKVSELISFV